MMSREKAAGTFFKDYQKKNVMRLLQDSLEKIINEWLKTDDESHTKLKSLQQLSEMDINATSFAERSPLPDFVTRLWLDPHKALDALDKNISKVEIRKLIKETAREIELIFTHQKAPDYS
ncbi:TPA: lpg2149 family Dot/Icm T4SS effector [Legionella pneumophila]|nr:lpg2149 family Dot/Icm T4SS effector [Legionella pneumophila]HAU1322225.1 lpg2149 family Dot/Icm T4SS effector [Legionella pneumophila]HBC0468753.1 lpg2149 family Dot/Icm T4SS effector [Legionella pneumophila]HBD9375923.1 lpg2149 family Dot/Icm T4SS effector [Legionella pneumophila]HBI2947857.1 lpg2149 family Dot/Icm T4SS effector [Legionella pneumophila]